MIILLTQTTMVGDRRAPAKQSDVGQSFTAADHDRLV
jgi:hypothetical protein